MGRTYTQMLREVLPYFERKEKATYARAGFMKRLENEMYEHDLFADQYTSRLEELGGWDVLEDIQFARECDMDACWVLMTAAS